MTAINYSPQKDGRKCLRYGEMAEGGGGCHALGITYIICKLNTANLWIDSVVCRSPDLLPLFCFVDSILN